MDRFHSLARWVASAALLILTACGGGGGGTPPGPGTTILARLGALLSGANEVSIADPDARGSVVLELRSDGQLRFAATAEADWVGAITGMHVHRGAAGINGAIEVDLLGNGATFAPATRSASDTLSITPALAQEIAGTPDAFYVNIHTSAASGGLVREQLSVLPALEAWTTLLGENEVPAAPAARGAAALTLAPDGTLAYVIATGTPTVDLVTAAHLHEGPTTANGGVIVDFDVPTATKDTVAGTIRAQRAVAFDVLTRLMLDPGAFYVNIHTATAPLGAARGQLTQQPGELWTPLRGDEETVVMDAAARGGVSVLLESLTRGRVHLAMPPVPPGLTDQAIGNLTGAHIHAGLAGFDGPVVADLRSGTDYTTSAPTGSAEGTFVITPALFARLLARPDAFYVNVHTSAAPLGIARGQLGQEPVQFFAALAGSEETTVVDATAAAVLNPLTFTGIFRCSFTADVTNPTAADITGLHIHNGGAGVDGSVLMDLLAAPDLDVGGRFLTGSTTLTGRTFARMMAYPEGFYANMHTLGAPAGLARGQCVHLTGDVPPGGLVYESPLVTYTTTVAIAPNVPTMSGGAVTSWSIAPPLSAGLQFSTVTGILSGTPSAAAPQTTYTVTATNSAGSTQALLTITVLVAPPAGLAYTTPVSYVQNSAITSNVPSSTGGAIASYSISPVLPTGLTLNTTTGVISGTPTVLSSATTYTVTATNASGTTTANISLEVVAALTAPSGLSYATNPASYPTGYAITANNPTVTGTVAQWSVSPALPTGLSLNTSTGVITGTPTVVTAQANYTVTASNAAGSTNVTMALTVTLGAPTGLSYSNNPAVGYVTGNTFPTMTPSAGGGAIASYSISPTLPAGVSINTTTGDISGAPTAQSASTTYTVTATNATGSTTASVTISVLP